MENKQVSPIQSRNFQNSILIAVISMLFVAIEGQGVPVNLEPEFIIDLFLKRDYAAIAAIVFSSGWTIITKLVENFKANKGLKYDWLKSDNFWANIAFLVSVVLGFYFGDVTAGVLIGGLIQALNIIAHFSGKPIVRTIVRAFGGSN